ncbi:MAG: GTP cyclohydrolase FolE2 [Pseudobdellovibrionaceae bacterium]
MDRATESHLPDVSQERVPAKHAQILDWVGMSGIELPLLWTVGSYSLALPAKVEAGVSLIQPEAKGIHMSRLYREVQAQMGNSPLSWDQLQLVMSEFQKSHAELSDQYFLSAEFAIPLQRESLKSSLKGWRTYPVKVSAQKTSSGEIKASLEVVVTYSSTCPMSAALSRQLIQENFKKSFAQKDFDLKDVYDWLGTTEGVIATPHAQRSFAKLKIWSSQLDPVFWIDLIERALPTPVQTVVKREDEQEFALRNGQNLMFCEDAARRLQAALRELPNDLLQGFEGEVRHAESLHPHDAVARFSQAFTSN